VCVCPPGTCCCCIACAADADIPHTCLQRPKLTQTIVRKYVPPPNGARLEFAAEISTRKETITWKKVCACWCPQ
jgi:hypothetical protein